MKKLVCILLTLALVLCPVSAVQAKHDNSKDKGHSKTYDQKEYNKKQKEFKVNEPPVIQNGRYKLPVRPVERGMGASVSYNNPILTITKDTVVIVINFNDKTVSINGIPDTDCTIFKASNSHKMTVLIQYIAEILGYETDSSEDEIIIINPELNAPVNVNVTPVGNVVTANTLNSTNTCLTAAANITAGQAAGGRAELYVGSRLVAVDSVITETDTSVTFTTSDGSPTNNELQAIVPSGGTVSVKLYNANGASAVSLVSNPSLTVDYTAPTLSSISSATYKPTENKLIINVTGAGANNDPVDVTKLTFIDYNLGKSYQLTAAPGTGSRGKVTGSTTLTVTIGSGDKAALAGFTSASFYLNIAAGSLLKDAAGNTSPSLNSPQLIPVNTSAVNAGLDAPSNITLVSIGPVEVTDALNSTSLYLSATAKITPGQATGGKAELYVGSKLVATDYLIASADNIVSFTTSDGSPTNYELQAAVPTGGVVTVRLYNAANNFVTSNAGNLNLAVDYVSPTLNYITSAVYNSATSKLYLTADGAGAIGDSVDVSRISLYDSYWGKSYTLTNAQGTGSFGTVTGPTSIDISLGVIDIAGLSGFGNFSVLLTIAPGSLLRDAAGNTSPYITTNTTVPVTVYR